LTVLACPRPANFRLADRSTKVSSREQRVVATVDGHRDHSSEFTVDLGTVTNERHENSFRYQTNVPIMVHDFHHAPTVKLSDRFRGIENRVGLQAGDQQVGRSVRRKFEAWQAKRLRRGGART